MQEPVHDLTPDGTYVFEVEREDGTRVVSTVFPEDIDEIAGPPSEPMGADERKRRYRVARLLAEPDLTRQLTGRAEPAADGDHGG